MKERLSAVCAYAGAIAVILVFLVSVIDINCFDRAFYEREYAAMDTAASLDMSHQDLMKATETLLDYLEDARDDIIVSIEVRDMPKEAFNERETLHMADVKHLYRFALHLRIGALVILFGALLILWVKKKRDMWELLAIGYAQCAFAFLCVVVFLGLWAAVDFSSLWESFHRLFFTNDLWLLNPYTDLMINMFPETFFFHMVLRIAGMFLICFIGLWIGSLWYLKKQHRLILPRKEKKQ